MITPHDKKTGRNSKKEGIGKMKRERKESKRIIEKVPPKKRKSPKKGPSPKDLIPKNVR